MRPKPGNGPLKIRHWRNADPGGPGLGTRPCPIFLSGLASFPKIRDVLERGQHWSGQAPVHRLAAINTEPAWIRFQGYGFFWPCDPTWQSQGKKHQGWGTDHSLAMGTPAQGLRLGQIFAAEDP